MTSVTVENIDSVHRLLESDRRLTVAEVASEIGISYSCAQIIFTDKLGFRTVLASWVSRLLTANQKR